MSTPSLDPLPHPEGPVPDPEAPLREAAEQLMQMGQAITEQLQRFAADIERLQAEQMQLFAEHVQRIQQESSAELVKMFDALDTDVRAMAPVARAFGALGWTMPMWAPPALVAVILRDVDPKRLDELFVNTYRKGFRAKFRHMCNDLAGRSVLAQWRALLDDCRYAFLRHRYRVVVTGLLPILEGVLAASIGALSHRRLKLRTIAPRHEAGSTFIAVPLWASVAGFVEQVYKDHDFGEARPALINRHWILHGRDAATWGEADCLRLFQAIDTISFVMQHGLEEST